jgi:hypothetical protein
MRFIANTAIDTEITYQNLLDIWLMTVSSTAAYDLFNKVRVRRVSVWAVPVIGNATTVELAFRGNTEGAVGPSKFKSDTSMGIEPAYVTLSPDKMSQAGQFQQSSANTAFNVICPTGSVIDVEASYQSDYGTALAAQNATVGTSIGFVANRGLDGLAKATSTMLPVTDVVV